MPEMLMVKLLSWDSSNFAFVLPYGPLLGPKDQTYWEYAKGSFCPETGQLLLEVIPAHLPGPAAVSYKPRPACTFSAGGNGCREERLLSNVYFPY